MDELLRRILDQPVWLIYLVTFLIVFAEDALFFGFVIPGETAAILGGVSVAIHKTDYPWMALVVVAAAIIGDSVGYEVGRVMGPRLLDNKLLRHRQAGILKAQTYLREKGALAVFLGRWTAFFRAMMPALAGASRMPYRTFLPWNAIGGLFWGIVCVSVGYVAGMSYQSAAKWLGGGAATIVALVVITALAVWHVRKRRAEKAEEEVVEGELG